MVCRVSYATKVTPNWGDDRSTLARPPLKSALGPSSTEIFLKASMMPEYVEYPFFASLWRRVLMTSAKAHSVSLAVRLGESHGQDRPSRPSYDSPAGVVRYAAGMPAIPAAVRVSMNDSFLPFSPSLYRSFFRCAYAVK